MTDAPTPSAGDQGAAPLAGAAEGGAPAPANPSWISSLPPELQSDATLSRYASIEDLARGHVESHKAAKAKAAIAHDSIVDNFDVFAASRPPEASAYDVPVPEGGDTGLADWFRDAAHSVGLHPAQAKALAEANNKFVAEHMAAQQQQLDQFKTEYNAGGGNYDASLQSVVQLLNDVDPNGALGSVDALESQIGAAPAMKFLFEIAKRFGEPGRASGQGQQPNSAAGLSPAEATAKRRELLKNPEWTAKASQEGTDEHKYYNDLIAAEAGTR